MSITAYAVLRLPYIYRKALHSSRRLNRVRRKRAELDSAVRKARAEIRQAKLFADSSAPAVSKGPGE
ncbi:MAG: hypothetical protein HUU20_26265 [Pirellulales bacterium]|nr:hypothetical protein [Pirellulales bacterium]